MNLEIIGLVFVVIFIAELPDKSLFASLILSTRFPAFAVWLGAAVAFLIHVIIAVTAGKLLTLLPHQVLEYILAGVFLLGAALVFFGKQDLTPEQPHIKLSIKDAHHFWKVFATSFGVVFIGEWGDITQIATANYAAHYHNALSVAIGAVLALWLVTALAILFGAKALKRVPAKLLQRVTGGVLLIFAVISLVTAIRG